MTNYADVEAAWLAEIQAMPEFDTTNSGRGNWKLLSSGNDDHYAILKPGTRSREMLTISRRLDMAQTIIQLWQRYVDDGTSLLSMESLVDATLTALDATHTFGGLAGVIDAEVTEVREMQQVPGDAPQWLLVELVASAQYETEL